MSNKVTVVVRNLSKTYRLTKTGSSRGLFNRGGWTEVEALKSVSFIAHEGDAIGVLGKNGSGKSTLMNIISGGVAPTTGDVLVSAQPTLLSVSGALQNHLSGTQNARLGLLAKGMEPREAEALTKEVIAWADLNDAADRPLKTYSSGMKARLKFALATAAPSEVLLIDEALATGDSAFTAKAKRRMDQFLGGTGTMLLVSHSASSIRKHCNRAIWINDGEVISDGSVREVSKPYERWNKARANEDALSATKIVEEVKQGYRKPSIVFDSEARKYFNTQYVG